jgi:hypothetical protein
LKERKEDERERFEQLEENMEDPFEIEFLPEFQEGRGPRDPFVNEYGVVIGDHVYVSEESPLEQWDKNTDPEIMSGDQWVHPFKDIGFQTEENREFFEKGIVPSPNEGARFMHPTKDVAYESNLENWDGESNQTEMPDQVNQMDQLNQPNQDYQMNQLQQENQPQLNSSLKKPIKPSRHRVKPKRPSNKDHGDLPH